MTRGSDRPLDDQPDRAIERRRKALQGGVEDYAGRRRSEHDDLPSDEDIERFSGVTVPCPGCGTVLHDDVGVCWNCGHDLESQPPRKGLFGGRAGRWTATGVAVAAILAILLLLFR